ncbi:MAG: hypothetical protein V1720_04630 [bacterium]
MSIFAFLTLSSCDAGEYDALLNTNRAESSDCKNYDVERFGFYSTSQECIEYEYVMRSYLQIKHINARFNCCPGEFIVESRFSGDSIIVKETTTERNCLCVCPYDLSYQIENVLLNRYYFKVDQGYPDGYETLEFEIDLTKQIYGVFCVERDF